MIPGILRDAAGLNGDSLFLRCGDQSISFGQMDEKSDRAANLFREIGIRRGDKVCLVVSRRPEFMELWFGLAKLGAVMVPMEASAREDTVSYIASHSDAAVLVVEETARIANGGRPGNFPEVRKKIWIGAAGGSPPLVNHHPKVLESAASGVLSGMDDEDVRVFIVPRPGEFLPPEEILRWCKERMAACLVPRYIELVSGLPKTESGGIRNYELRKRPLREERPRENFAAK